MVSYLGRRRDDLWRRRRWCCGPWRSCLSLPQRWDREGCYSGLLCTSLYLFCTGCGCNLEDRLANAHFADDDHNDGGGNQGADFPEPPQSVALPLFCSFCHPLLIFKDFGIIYLFPQFSSPVFSPFLFLGFTQRVVILNMDAGLL